MKFRELFNKWADIYNENDIGQESLKILFSYFYNIKSEMDFIFLMDKEVKQLSRKQINILKKVSTGYPVQYAMKKAYFCGYDFYVNKNVLIPRPETEELVFGVINFMKKHFYYNKKYSILDLGTGSGNILISIEKNSYFRFENLIGVDLSKKALSVARKNKKYLGSAGNFKNDDMISFVQNCKQKFDIITCNPPYIGSESEIDKNVLDNEPRAALLAKPDTFFYEKLIDKLLNIVNDKFIIAFEIGYNQKEKLENFIKISRFCRVFEYKFEKDINGKDRMLYIYSV